MFLKSAAVLAAVALLLSQSSAQTCSSEYTSKVFNDRCDIECGPQKCLCSDDPSSGSVPFNACLQKCNTSPRGSNDTVTSCPDMKCTNLDSCFQTCSTDSCNMECKAKKTCNQECGAGCKTAICTAPQCFQQCSNCTMECTSEAKECHHMCTGGVCYSKCSAQSCKRECIAGGSSCTINSSVLIHPSVGHLCLILGFMCYLIKL